MKVFKFGGASLKDAENITNVAHILQHYSAQSLLLVVSAMGKTTNALEEIVRAHSAGDTAKAYEHLEAVRKQHFALAAELFDPSDEIFTSLNDIFVEVEWVLEEPPHENFDYMYDQIVSVGELASSKIVTAFLIKKGFSACWLDVRGVLSTDNTYREARIDWAQTQAQMERIVKPMLATNSFVVTQGFIGSTSENFTTTLGREGSDYTAAIFSFCLNAESMTIWKDVAGVLTADPRIFENVTKIDRLSYREAIEMTYYGATVIHPKTIKPLQNKNIPLRVKSFLQPEANGTLITDDTEANYPPIIIVEKNQTLLHIASRDFSFIAEHHLSRLFSLFDKHRIWVNMMRNTAISFLVCVPNHSPERLKMLFADMDADFTVTEETGVELVTVRHYHESILENLKANKIVLLEERIPKMFQMVTKSVPIMKLKEPN